ncbi:hypothetical protein M413DRAFT_441963 [Hebeloma cylindrosporum]|uniref:Uncharacterized protein n=1 Tax=Hebeloma cylindrosporum TaxID=76867 RepID=A0A0C2YWB5_HEBCY|nr:hypothetical protein M413DRAFT_441963 [Hebeloma cylindrosporum h7]
MHLFKRSKSTIAKKQQDSNLPSSSRPPLTNNNRTTDEAATRSNVEGPALKQFLGRKISYRNVDEHGKAKSAQSVASPSAEDLIASHSTDALIARGLAPAPPRTSPRSAKTTYANHPDLYTHNDLNTFSFGAAPSSSSSSSYPHPVDPLSRHDVDSDEPGLIPDTTPRPSVVGSQQPRNHQSQLPGLENRQTSFFDSRLKPPNMGVRPGEKLQERDTDTASNHTFGTSSASVSVSSFSGQREYDSATSANDLTSDEEFDGRHPLPPEPLDPSAPEHSSSLYPSEEEFDGYNEDYEHDEIEIDPEIDEEMNRGTFSSHPNDSRDSFRVNSSERRGSAAMQIPNTASDRAYQEHRARGNSLATLRRPSKSLEELYSFSFGKASGPSSSRGPEDPLPPTPTSVPESEGDWRDLRKRSVQRDKDLPPIFPPASIPSTASTSKANANMSLNTTSFTSDVLGFDSSWMQPYGVNGVVGFDPSEMADIVGEGHNGHRPSLYSLRKGSTSSAFRRYSTVSSNIDIWHKNIIGVWANQKYRDQRQMWTFTKEKDRIADEDANAKTRPQLLPERERPSISTFFAARPSISSGVEPSLVGSIPFFDKPDPKEKVAVREKSKEPWKGMALDSEEIWYNGSSGRFRVTRRNATSVELAKPPQQRLTITYLRSPYIVNATNREAADGPAVTIHKHSKAGAFSIGRYYRAKTVPLPHNTTMSFRNPSDPTGQTSSKDSTDGARKKTNTILLAPRRVQKSYTSTTTTRKLQSHGLLDESGRTSPRDRERMRRDEDHERRARAKAKGKEKERTDKDKDKDQWKTKESSTKRSAVKRGDSKGDTKSKDILTARKALPESSGGSSAGSVTNGLSSDNSGTLVNGSNATPDLSDATSSFGSVISVDPSVETTSSDRTISHQNLYRNHPPRRGVSDIDEDDDSSDERPRYPTRTPHRETYAALPPEVFESAHQGNPSHGLFNWAKSKDGERGGHRANPYLEASYKPPWPVTQPRFNPETRKGIVDDLNTSFQDVGLLPAIGEIKSNDSQHKRKREQHQSKRNKRVVDRNQTDIFEDFPDDALYMLLPLWPGETDPSSTRKYPYVPNTIPTHSRQYLLIYYKTPPPPVLPQEESNKSKSSEKKRYRELAGDSVHEGVVFLNTFHITARVVSYRDLQGSGVRIPDAGLAVSGPLFDAYDYLPSSFRQDEYVIGVCDSRESGVEFVPEGFEKMGLTRNVPNPRAAEFVEDDDSGSFDTLTILTPVGRAVMEMAWLGGMALTSFNPNP